MKKLTVFILVSFLFVACSSAATETSTQNLDLDSPIETAISLTKTASITPIDSPDETSSLEETQPVNATEPVSVPPTSIPDSGPNLELYVYHISREPIGNGMDRLSIYLLGRNASTGWHSYEFLGSYGYCNLGSKEDKSANNFVPILRTTEGYDYEANSNRYDPTCDNRRTGLIPPGSLVTFISSSYHGFKLEQSSIYDWPLVYIEFEIAESVTPESVYLKYSCDNLSTPECSSIRDISVNINMEQHISDQISLDTVPFDLAYNLEIYDINQRVRIGDVAEVYIGSPEIVRNTETINLSINITNLNNAYPIILYSWMNKFYLFRDDGGICCVYSSDFRAPSDDLQVEIGPLQSYEAKMILNATKPYASQYWLVGQVGITVLSLAETTVEYNWVTDLGSIPEVYYYPTPTE